MHIDSVDRVQGLDDLYEFLPKLMEDILKIADAGTVSLNMIVDEYGFITSFTAGNKESIKGKYIDRFCIVKAGPETSCEDSIKGKSFSVEQLVSRFDRGSSFKFIFEGRMYFLYDDENYLRKLINEGYLNKNFMKTMKKIYRDNWGDENFRRQYPTMSHFLEKITIPLRYGKEVYGFVSIDRINRSNKKKPFSEQYLIALETAIDDIAKRLYEKIKSINDELFKTLSKLQLLKKNLNRLEKPSYTYSHCDNVAALYYGFIRELDKKKIVKLKISDKVALRIGALFHDIGKIAIPLEILNKPSRLTDEEFEVMKRHPLIGYRILKDLKLPENAYKLVLYHHEKLDGSGYPYHLKGDDIPKVVQAFTIVDIFEALIGRRPYKKKLSIDEAFEILEEMAWANKINGELLNHFESYIVSITAKEDISVHLDRYAEQIKDYLKSRKVTENSDNRVA